MELKQERERMLLLVYHGVMLMGLGKEGEVYMYRERVIAIKTCISEVKSSRLNQERERMNVA